MHGMHQLQTRCFCCCRCLQEGKPQAGQRLLVLAASGGAARHA
jgi:hypothetical protein